MSSLKDSKDNLWPSLEYFQQLPKLYDAIGQDVYIVPLLDSHTHLTFSMTGKALKLIDIIDFAQTDPEKRLYPHMLIFADGSGLNLGKLMKVSKNTAFNPDTNDILYEDRPMQKLLMYTPRKLNKQYLHFVSRYALGDILGKKEITNLTYQAEDFFCSLENMNDQDNK